MPLNGQPNKLKVDKEPFMKQSVTDLDGSNESVSFFNNQIEHFTFDTLFGDFPVDVASMENEHRHSQITHLTSVPFSSTVVHNV